VGTLVLVKPYDVNMLAQKTNSRWAGFA